MQQAECRYGTHHNGFGGVHGQAADRHDVALEGLGHVERLHIHCWEAQPRCGVCSYPTLQHHMYTLDLCEHLPAC